MTQSQRTPVLIGMGQHVERGIALQEAHSPQQMLAKSAERAAADAGLRGMPKDLNDIIVVNSVGRTPANPPAILARAIGTLDARLQLTVTGGNTPQMLVNHACNVIARGESESFLLAGAEALDTVQRARRQKFDLGWDYPDEDPAPLFSAERDPCSPYEQRYGLFLPINTYPLFENALRRHYGRDIASHQLAVAELFSRFSAVAAANAYAWFQEAHTPAEIAEPTDDNRYVGFPYTKLMNAIIRVNQAAAVLIVSEAKADALGVPRGQRVYLHGGADANDVWHVTERRDFHSSPAIRLMGQQVLAMAGKTIADIRHFDLYSCFPAVVQIARDELGIGADDPRDLTVTGGLPYFGGPGNNYTMHAIAAMMQRLRSDPGAFGLVTGNGWYVTKHSMGVYSTARPEQPLALPDAAALQASIDAAPRPTVVEQANGSARVETYTVLHSRSGPETGLVVGRLDGGERFLANTPAGDVGLLHDWMRDDPIGTAGSVRHIEGRNVFAPDVPGGR